KRWWTGLAKPTARDSTAFPMWRVLAGRHDWTAWLRASWRRHWRNRQNSSACHGAAGMAWWWWSFCAKSATSNSNPVKHAIAQATGLCLEASGPPLHPSQQQGSCPFSTRAEKKLHRIVEQSEKALLVFADESGFSLHPKLGRVWAKR